MDRVRRAMGAGTADDETISDSASSGSKELRHAVHELRRAMEEKWSSPRDEQLRVAQILTHATADILGKIPRG
jgi:hypothetical protein